MSLFTLFILAVGLSMDAFAVAVCKGLAMKKITAGKAVTVGLWFGGFQAGMPLAGYLLGIQFRNAITAIDHWIAFILLGIIGINMVREALQEEEEETDMDVEIVPAVAFIGITTFALSVTGVKAGNIFGEKYQARAELAGGVILILLGFKILLEHLGIL